MLHLKNFNGDWFHIFIINTQIKHEFKAEIFIDLFWDLALSVMVSNLMYVFIIWQFIIWIILFILFSQVLGEPLYTKSIIWACQKCSIISHSYMQNTNAFTVRIIQKVWNFSGRIYDAFMFWILILKNLHLDHMNYPKPCP